MDKRLNNLTAREQQVADLLVSGKRNAEIADALGISVRTVEKHVQNVLRKMRMTSRRELMVAVLTHQATKP